MAVTARNAVWSPTDHERLLSLMDALTAVQIDLSPLCGHVPAAADAKIAGACELLQTAIRDLRGIISQLDDIVEPAGSQKSY